MKLGQKPTIQLYRMAANIFGSPAVRLSLGNLALASQTADPTGITISSLTTVAAVVGCIYEQVTDKPAGLPFAALAAVNLATAGSVVSEAYHNLGIDGLMHLSKESIQAWSAALAFTGWGIGHGWAASHSKRKTQPKSPLTDQQTYYGVGDLSAVRGDPVATTFFALGLAKAFKFRNIEIGTVKSVKDFVQKHVTPSRLYGAGYFLGAAATLSNPVFSVAQIAWGLGYIAFDKKLDSEIRDDIKRVPVLAAQLTPFNLTADALGFTIGAFAAGAICYRESMNSPYALASILVSGVAGVAVMRFEGYFNHLSSQPPTKLPEFVQAQLLAGTGANSTVTIGGDFQRDYIVTSTGDIRNGNGKLCLRDTKGVSYDIALTKMCADTIEGTVSFLRTRFLTGQTELISHTIIIPKEPPPHKHEPQLSRSPGPGAPPPMGKPKLIIGGLVANPT